MAARNESKEIKLVRVYDAPVKTVWDAWTDPEQAANWWGPRGFTITTHSKDLRPGGHWHYIMHGPDGVDYPNKTKYLEVEEHARLVYDHGGNDEQKPLFRVTVTFSETKGKTRMEMSMAFESAGAAEEGRKFIKKAGGDATWDRLAEYLATETEGKEKFVINRRFDAPLETMFRMWADPEHIQRWLPPTGFTMKYLKGAEIRPGVETFYAMSGNGVTMYGKARYLEIRSPDRVVYTQQFADEKGNVARHPMSPTWPETMLTTVELSEEEPGRTRVTITWEPYGKFTAEELSTFVKARSGMTQGWTGSLDKLEAYLEKQPR